MPSITPPPLQSNEFAVLATLKRAPSELSSYQRKVRALRGLRAGQGPVGRLRCRQGMAGACPIVSFLPCYSLLCHQEPSLAPPTSPTHKSNCSCALSALREQVFKIDDHMGIAISGLTADGRILCRYMRNECLNHR